jgi:hypothetical protein
LIIVLIRTESDMTELISFWDDILLCFGFRFVETSCAIGYRVPTVNRVEIMTV